jgi:hypothetical protein
MTYQLAKFPNVLYLTKTRQAPFSLLCYSAVLQTRQYVRQLLFVQMIGMVRMERGPSVKTGGLYTDRPTDRPTDMQHKESHSLNNQQAGHVVSNNHQRLHS